MVLLICTLVNLHVTVHAEKTGHILTGTDQSTFRLFFSDLRFQDTLSGIPACIFMKKIQLHPSQTVKYRNNCYQDVKCIPNVKWIQWIQLPNLAQELTLLFKFTSSTGSSDMLIILFLFESMGANWPRRALENLAATQRQINIEVLPHREK